MIINHIQIVKLSQLKHCTKFDVSNLEWKNLNFIAGATSRIFLNGMRADESTTVIKCININCGRSLAKRIQSNPQEIFFQFRIKFQQEQKRY